VNKVIQKRIYAYLKWGVLLSKNMAQKTILAIAVLIVFLSPTLAQNFVMGQGGNDYCPQSVDKKFCRDIIIIGGGMAGLGAANDLKSHGYYFIVLESASALGGRVVTAHSSINGIDVTYDTHASFISGSTGNPITELAQRYNAGFQLTDYNNVTTYDEKGLITDQTRLSWMWNLYNVTFLSYMNNERQNMQKDEPLQTAIDNFIQNQNLTDSQKKDFLFEISSNIGDAWAADPINISLLYWNKIGYIVAGHDDAVFPHGFGQIVNGLVNETGSDNIQTKMSVTHVYYSDRGVKVETDNGNGPTYYGKYVICTLPINVLQTNSVQFTPDLPQNKTDAINRMEMGTLAQTYIYFKNGVFWDNTDWISYIPPLNETGHFVTFQNMYKVNGQPMLLAFNYGNYALQLLTESDQKIKKDLIKVLDNMYPGKVTLNDIKIVYRGETPSYSTNPIGFKVPNDYDLLASPVADDKGVDRLFFAGEATTWHFPATTHGAFISGLREANRVMVTDTGKYPSPLEQGKSWRYPAKLVGEPYWKTFPEYVMCKQGFVLLAKSSDMSPLCIKPEFVQRLVQSNFARDPTLP
jgi:monoamine oxidase